MEASKETKALRKETQILFSSIKDIVLQLLASQEFRQTFSDSIDLLQDVLTFGLQTAKDKANEKLDEAAAAEGAAESLSEEGAEGGKKRKGRGGARGGRGGKKTKTAVAKGAAVVEEVQVRAEAAAAGYVPLTQDEIAKIRERSFALFARVAANESYRRVS